MSFDVHCRVKSSNAQFDDDHVRLAPMVFGVIISVPGLIFRTDPNQI